MNDFLAIPEPDYVALSVLTEKPAPALNMHVVEVE